MVNPHLGCRKVTLRTICTLTGNPRSDVNSSHSFVDTSFASGSTNYLFSESSSGFIDDQ